MFFKSWESSRIIVATVTSLHDRNISPRTVAENQTELESSGQTGRPKPEKVCERFKSKAATGV